LLRGTISNELVAKHLAMTRFRCLLPWVAASLGIVISAYLFYPGYLTWDSAYQWWQVRNGLVDTTHPPIMVWIWGLTNQLLAGPGGYFLFQLGLYWLSLGLFVSSLRLGTLWQASLVLLLGFWAPLWGLSLHLWKDVGTMSFFCLAAACFARDLVKPHFAWRTGALVAILLACPQRDVSGWVVPAVIASVPGNRRLAKTGADGSAGGFRSFIRSAIAGPGAEQRFPLPGLDALSLFAGHARGLHHADRQSHGKTAAGRKALANRMMRHPAEGLELIGA
jgi:hypothetical protein